MIYEAREISYKTNREFCFFQLGLEAKLATVRYRKRET